MKTLTEAEFLEWARTRGLRPADTYPKSVNLHYESQPPHASDNWSIPREPERRPYFFASLLEALGDWSSCFVWRHSGSWPSGEDLVPEDDTALIEHRIFTGLGLPLGTSDIVEFTRADYDSLLTLLFTTSVFGWAIIHDLYVVPDHAREFLTVSHHDKVFVTFENAGDLEGWVEIMAPRGFQVDDAD